MFELIDELRDKICALYNFNYRICFASNARPLQDGGDETLDHRRPEPRALRQSQPGSLQALTKSHPVVRSRRPSRRPDLRITCRRAQRRSMMAEGHREAARSVIDGREHDGTLAAEGRQYHQHAPHRRLCTDSHRR